TAPGARRPAPVASGVGYLEAPGRSGTRGLVPLGAHRVPRSPHRLRGRGLPDVPGDRGRGPLRSGATRGGGPCARTSAPPPFLARPLRDPRQFAAALRAAASAAS